MALINTNAKKLCENRDCEERWHDDDDVLLLIGNASAALTAVRTPAINCIDTAIPNDRKIYT